MQGHALCPRFSLRHLCVLSGIAITVLGFSQPLWAHGYADFPRARQAYCELDGGYWWPPDGSAIPNAACRAAFLTSGTYQFYQAIEFAKLVADYRNMEAVKAAVPDGTLCAGGDSAKAGMDVPHPDWQVQYLELDDQGRFEFRYYAATPHDPSYFQFFLTKPGFDPATETLTWDHLDLVDEVEDAQLVTIEGKKYYIMQVSLPTNRSGRAILYTRWQRIDPAGEGFYNCSDIWLVDDVTPPAWVSAGSYVTPDVAPEPGDEVWFRIFDGSGAEQVFTVFDITADNADLAVWTRQLATAVNDNETAARVGVLRDDAVVYDAGDLFANKVYVRDAEYSYQLDVKKPNTNTPPVVQLPAAVAVASGDAFSLTAAASDADGDPLSYAWRLPSDFTAVDLGSATLEATAPTVPSTQTFTLTVEVSDGEVSVFASSEVTVTAAGGGCDTTDPDAGNHPAWQSGSVYQSGDVVSHNQLVWRANWWTNSEEPSQQSQVWSLLSDVPTFWNAAIAYPAGSEVHHDGAIWRNQWWVQGEEPGVASVWERIGDSDCF
ncbi:Lytic polysaccharide monooxygenase [Sulfidibacter corallicola]|uniref:Lytic polysaccharide monooxygenase n=1 Tax=Sulfidibacter corallicola TaxID=2818388 RepID=A0A8A4TYV8_SULCO|nr:lytic polysaccharide monooxygenase [Sulfidibacter corallicola]QTD51705.1 lytic polysaccharide monooxygenase [Sulfidibacter corallicola]